MKTHLGLLIFLLTLVAIAPLPVFANQTDAANAISTAKSTILDCYHAAKEAETASANITTLVDSLNEAGLLLSQAELAYSENDFDMALDLAIQSQNSLDNFVVEANYLQETATKQQTQGFLVNVVGSFAGTIAVIVAGFVVWLFFLKKSKR